MNFSHNRTFSVLSMFAGVSLLAYPAISSDDDLFSMSLEQLTEVEVTSLSKRTEKASEVSAAIHVITSNDIKRSGATSIPELLRLAPGVNVARAGTGQWAISIRGFNAQFSNKLLILIDGRSVYTPLFSGVFWDAQDTLIEDIDRIEIVRGPGGTIWGANAVNGVINIITKHSADTQGTVATYQHGFQEQKSSIRYGGEIDKNTHYRAFLKQKHARESSLVSGDGAGDSLDQARAGLRVDMHDLPYGNLTLQSELYQGSNKHDMILPTLSGAFSTANHDKWDIAGGHLLANWDYSNNGNEYSIKTYYDFTSRDTVVFESDVHSFDIDFNHSFEITDRHNLMWGLGYRLVSTDINNTDYITYTPSQRNDSLFSAFIQDKISLYEDEAFLTIGGKFEHNDYTGFEWQPSARLNWLINDNQTLWGSVSRAVRTPSRASHDIAIAVAGIPSSASPTGSLLATQISSDAVDSEELIAYEVGYRVQPSKDISLDLTGFYNDYTDLASDSRSTPFVSTNQTFGTHAVLPFLVGNDSSGETFGFEVSADWQALPSLVLSSSYSYMEMDINGSSTFVSGEGLTPNHQINFESHYTPNNNWEFDAILHYVDELNPSVTSVIPSYWKLDTRVAYNFDNGLSLSLVGQNLLDSQTAQFSSFVYNRQIEIPRTVYGKLSWKF